MTAADCSCGHGDLPAHFHMTPCPVKVRHLRDCADARKARQVRPALSLVSDRPEWCGECDEWTRLRDYDSTPYRCPEWSL